MFYNDFPHLVDVVTFQHLGFIHQHAINLFLFSQMFFKDIQRIAMIVDEFSIHFEASS